jgi:hypothetical protein
MIFAARNLPIEHLPAAIRPEAESHQHDHLFAAALPPLSVAFIRLDLLLLALDRHPDAIQLDHGGHISDPSLCKLK